MVKIMGKPKWLPHEGWWRVLKIIRVIPFLLLVLSTTYSLLLGTPKIPDDLSTTFLYASFYLTVCFFGFVGAVLIQGAVRLIVYLYDGFKIGLNNEKK